MWSLGCWLEGKWERRSCQTVGCSKAPLLLGRTQRVSINNERALRWRGEGSVKQVAHDMDSGLHRKQWGGSRYLFCLSSFVVNVFIPFPPQTLL